MAQENIIIGSKDAKGGDTLFDAFTKIQSNFTELYNDNLNSAITVNQSNLAETLGGAIDSTKVYLIDGIVDFTGTGLSINVPIGGVSISGSFADICKLICSDPGYSMFVSAGCGNISVVGLSINVTGTGSQVYSCTDIDGTNAVEVIDVNYNDCSSLGELTGFRQYLESNTGRFGGTPQVTFSGAWSGGAFINTSLARGLVDGAYSLYKAGTAFTMQSRFRTNQNIDLPASASFIDFAPVNFPNTSTIQLNECILTRNGVSDATDTNISPNIDASNLSCQWDNNNGIQNTFVGGELVLTTEATTTIATTGVFVDVAGTFTASDLQHFDSPAQGQLRHLGSTPKEFVMQGEAVIESTANDEVDVKVVIYRAATATFEDSKIIRRVINNLQGGRDVAYFSFYANVVLNENDYLKLQVANVSSTNNITVELDSSYLVSAR